MKTPEDPRDEVFVVKLSNVIPCACLVLSGTPLLMLGCGAPDMDSTDPETSQVSQAENHGSQGTNGLTSKIYQDFDEVLSMATSGALVSSLATFEVTNSYVLHNLLNSAAGQEVFQYAIGCALPAGWAVHSAGLNYKGLGHLADGTDWLTGPLSTHARAALLECMVAHVNPLGIHVPILLSGTDVRNDGGAHDEFDVDEALWLVGFNNLGVPRTQVWPLPSFAKACGPDPLFALQQRVCGHDPTGCDLTPRGDFDTACVLNARGDYTCDGQPVIRTTLSTKGFVQMYGPIVCPG